MFLGFFEILGGICPFFWCRISFPAGRALLKNGGVEPPHLKDYSLAHISPCGGDVGAWIDLAWPPKTRLGHKNCRAPQSGLIFCPIFQIMVGVAMLRYIVVLLDTSFEIISIY